MTGGGVPLVGGEVVWQGNGAASNVDASTSLTPQYVFLAPRGWDIKPAGASFVTADPGATFDYRTVTYGGNSHQAVIVTWPAPTTSTGAITFPALQVKTTPTGAATPGTSNQVGYFFMGEAANGLADAYGNAKVVDTTDVDDDGVTTDVFSRGSGTTSLAASAAIGLTKEICRPDLAAADGCQWISDSSVKVGVPPSASSIKYRVTIQNKGNADLTNAVAYDVLPYPDDVGTTTATAGTPRGSSVKEELVSVSAVGSGLALSYSSSTSPPRPEVFSGPISGDWSDPMSGASAIQVRLASLAPGQSRSFVYEAALVGGSADQVACNSVAVAATGLVAVEPRPVCATTQEADLGIEPTNRLPLQAGRVGVVPFAVTNHGGSQSATGTVTLDVPAAVTVNSLTVSGWSCTAPSMQGPVAVTCAPVTGTGAPRTLELDVADPLALSVRPTEQAPAQLCFHAAVTTLMFDPETGNDETQLCSTALSAKPELLVSKDDGRSTVSVGEEYTYTLSASSRLVSEPIGDVVLTDTLPQDLELVSALPAPTTVAGQLLRWDLGRLEAAGIPSDGGDLTSGGPGSSRSVAVTVRVRPGTQDDVTNSAVATGMDPADPAITLSAQDDDVDSVLNVFTDLGAEETTPQNTSVTTPLAEIASTTGAPIDPRAVTQATAPAHGSLTIDADTGAVTFTPASGFTGEDSYLVRVCDTSSPTAQCFLARVQVSVGANLVTAVDDAATTDAGQPVGFAVLLNDTSASGQSLGAADGHLAAVQGVDDRGSGRHDHLHPRPGHERRGLLRLPGVRHLGPDGGVRHRNGHRHRDEPVDRRSRGGRGADPAEPVGHHSRG